MAVSHGGVIPRVMDTSDTARTAFNVRLPKDLLAQVDDRAENLSISRNQWYENMTRWVLANTYIIEERGGKP
jgi:metal-responsive CopG/Arc/MetJ family transcriptional regulator